MWHRPIQIRGPSRKQSHGAVQQSAPEPSALPIAEAESGSTSKQRKPRRGVAPAAFSSVAAHGVKAQAFRPACSTGTTHPTGTGAVQGLNCEARWGTLAPETMLRAAAADGVRRRPTPAEGPTATIQHSGR